MAAGGEVEKRTSKVFFSREARKKDSQWQRGSQSNGNRHRAGITSETQHLAAEWGAVAQQGGGVLGFNPPCLPTRFAWTAQMGRREHSHVHFAFEKSVRPSLIVGRNISCTFGAVGQGGGGYMEFPPGEIAPRLMVSS